MTSVAAAFAAVFGGGVAPAQEMGAGGCTSCHQGIEEMHPWAAVTCVQCHGGNDRASKKEEAHVVPRQRPPGDERVLGQQWDLESTRFLDPGNLRVAALTCGPCHAKSVDDTVHSLHATTSGHLGDGLYENGVVAERHPSVSVFNVRDSLPDDAPRPPGAVPFLRQIGAFASGGEKEKLSTHFTDLPRKACMQCHLWSRGRAVRGRAGMDGDYRGEGCTACHVPYADDGLSQSKDPVVDKFEPGHPREHRMVRFPTTDTCVRCHYGDASIGLSFRGLAQPVPGMPQTPDAPGLHRKRLNGAYYIDDPAASPPDVHHQKGMHCVDCHTRNDVMGDGFLYRRMEDQVEIECESCHGTADAYATGTTRKGTKLAHIEKREDGWWLKGRVDGKLHRLKQARDVVRPGSADYNSAAAIAMSSGDHAKLACYVCHSAWNPNFFGFHFDRNEAFTQLDLLNGTRTPGRVTTQEKVFSTFKNFFVGWDSKGHLAPYMVGFSSMATIHDKDGAIQMEQELPVTRAGLSGMTMVHHQTHTTTARARQCAECHRSPAALGRGSANFRLAREFVAVGGDAGLRIVAIDRKTPGNTALVAALPIPQVRAVAYVNDRLTGRATLCYAASAEQGLVVVDVASPGFPRVIERVEAACVSPEALLVAASRLYVADGEAGLKVFDVSQPTKPKLVGQVKLPAYGLSLDGPWLFVAAGTRGLVAVDVRDPVPQILGAGLAPGGSTSPADCRSVATLFQYSRPNRDLLEGPRSKARNLAAVGTTGQGVFLCDVTEPAQPRVVSRVPGEILANLSVTGVALTTIYELGSEGGAIPSRERDLLVFTHPAPSPGLALFDVTDPVSPQFVGVTEVRAGVRSLRLARVYNPPFLQSYAVTVDPAGVQLVDITRPSKPVVAASVAGLPLGRCADVEEFPLDRAVDADGKPILDVSHEGARWLDRSEYLRVLGAPLLADPGAPEPPGAVK